MVFVCRSFFMESLNVVEERESSFHTNKINPQDTNNTKLQTTYNFFRSTTFFRQLSRRFQKLQFSLIDYLKSHFQ